MDLIYMKIFLFFCGAVFSANSEVTDSTQVASVKVIPDGACPEIQCRVYNWENMTCAWNSTPVVNYDLHWSRGVDECKSGTWCEWADCAVQLSNSCIWSRDFDGDGYFDVDPHALRLEPQSKSSNAADKCGIVYIDPDDLVEPDPVKNLKVADKESRSAEITWDSPAEVRTLVYRVRYSRISSRGVEEISAEKLTNRTRITLLNLRPGFTYFVQIDGRPLKDDNFESMTGFWSSTASVMFRTLDDVPEQAPLVTSGGFYDMKSFNGSTRSVVVYWKDIPEYFRNGNITEIRIRYRKVWPDISPRPPVSWQEKIRVRETSITLDLEGWTDYEIMIDARTSAGYNESLKLQRIIVPSNKSGTYVNAQDFVVLMNSSVFYMTWNQSHNVDISYIVYLCRQLASNNVCDAPLEWIAVPQNQTWLIFNRSIIDGVDFLDLGVGISAEYTVANTTISSGIQWNKCFYNMTAELKTPEGLKAQPSEGSITLGWNAIQDTCSKEEGYFSHYVVQYWPAYNDTDIRVKWFSTQELNWKIPESELEPGYSYHWCVKSWSKLNESACSKGPLFNSTGLGHASSVIIAIVVSIIAVAFVIVVVILRRRGRCNCEIPIKIPVVSNGSQYIDTNGSATARNPQYRDEYEAIRDSLLGNLPSIDHDTNHYEEIGMNSYSTGGLYGSNGALITSSFTNNNQANSRSNPTESLHADPNSNSGRAVSDIGSYNLIFPPIDSESYREQPRSSLDPNRNPVDVTDQSSIHLGTSDHDLSTARFDGSAPLNYDSSQSNGISSYPAVHFSSGGQSGPQTGSQSDRLLGLSGGSNIESGFSLPDPSLEPENRESEPLLLLRESSVGQQEDLDGDLETRSRSESESSDPYRGMGIERVLDCEELTAREALEQEEQSRQEPQV